MSLKQDIEMVKEELNSEEKFFEKAVITEKFVKKYKNLMIASVVGIVVLVGANIGYTINKQNRLDAANAALVKLTSEPSNAIVTAELKNLSPALYDVWQYSQAVANKDLVSFERLKSSKSVLISDLATYNLASESKDLSALSAYTLQQNAIYKDLAQIQAAVLLMNSSKMNEAHEKLSMISIDSPLAQVANALMHYGVK
ncbi:MAG: hypothetical protein QM497_06485 [Sulfurimonas sp.]